MFRSASSRVIIKRLDYLIFLLHIPKANWTCDLITDYRKSLKLVTIPDYDDVEINIYMDIYWTCDIASLHDLESIGLKTILYHLWGISVITLR